MEAQRDEKRDRVAVSPCVVHLPLNFWVYWSFPCYNWKLGSDAAEIFSYSHIKNEENYIIQIYQIENILTLSCCFVCLFVFIIISNQIQSEACCFLSRPQVSSVVLHGCDIFPPQLWLFYHSGNQVLKIAWERHMEITFLCSSFDTVSNSGLSQYNCIKLYVYVCIQSS